MDRTRRQRREPETRHRIVGPRVPAFHHEQAIEVQERVGQQRFDAQRFELPHELEEPLRVADLAALARGCPLDGKGLLHLRDAPEELRPLGILRAACLDQVFHGQPQGLEVRIFPSGQRLGNVPGAVIEFADSFEVLNRPGGCRKPACLYRQNSPRGVGIASGQHLHVVERPIPGPYSVLPLRRHLPQRRRVGEVAPERFPDPGACRAAGVVGPLGQQRGFLPGESFPAGRHRIMPRRPFRVVPEGDPADQHAATGERHRADVFPRSAGPANQGGIPGYFLTAALPGDHPVCRLGVLVRPGFPL